MQTLKNPDAIGVELRPSAMGNVEGSTGQQWLTKRETDRRA